MTKSSKELASNASSTFSSHTERLAADQASLEGLGASYAVMSSNEGGAPRNSYESTAKLLRPSQLVPNDFNPNRLSPRRFAGLVAEMRRNGINRIAIMCRPLGEDRFEIIAGEQTWRAAGEAGLEFVEAKVVEVDDYEARRLCIVQNLKGGVDKLKYGRLLRQMLAMTSGLTNVGLAKKLGISEGTIRNRLLYDEYATLYPMTPEPEVANMSVRAIRAGVKLWKARKEEVADQEQEGHTNSSAASDGTEESSVIVPDLGQPSGKEIAPDRASQDELKKASVGVARAMAESSTGSRKGDALFDEVADQEARTSALPQWEGDIDEKDRRISELEERLAKATAYIEQLEAYAHHMTSKYGDAFVIGGDLYHVLQNGEITKNNKVVDGVKMRCRNGKYYIHGFEYMGDGIRADSKYLALRWYALRSRNSSLISWPGVQVLPADRFEVLIRDLHPKLWPIVEG